jgi:plastocyanin
MKRILTLAALAAIGPLASFVGCEGEPPVQTPENATAVASEVVSAAPSASTQPPPGAPSMSSCPPPPCLPTTSAVASASATPASSGAPSVETTLPVPPTAVARGNIVGTVTTQPAALQSQAVVYLEDGPNEDAPGHLQSVTIANRQMNFVPYVSVIAVGGKAVFVNDDPFPHNVFSPDNEKFNMGNIPQNGAHFRVFKAPGAYSLLCNLHPGMLGYLLVTPSTWAARGDPKGKFTMKHVPSGTYRITAWAPRQRPITKSVIVADGDVTVNVDIHR